MRLLAWAMAAGKGIADMADRSKAKAKDENWRTTRPTIDPSATTKALSRIHHQDTETPLDAFSALSKRLIMTLLSHQLLRVQKKK